MSFIELAMLVDQTNQILKIDCTDEGYKRSLEKYIGVNISKVLGFDYLTTVVELENRFFETAEIKLEHGRWILLSSKSFLKELYEEALNKVAEGIQIFDRNGYFVYGNPASEALEDYDVKDFKGRHLLDLYNLTEDISTTLSVIRTKKPVLNRCDRFLTKEDKDLVTINSGYPLMIEKGIYGAVTFESDLSVINNIRNKSFNLEAFIRNDQPILDTDWFSFKDIVHVSDEMSEKIKFAKKIALTNTNVLIIGETGTGKELFAQSIHSYSPRCDKPFIDVNCSAVPSNLIESLFFGTEKGAFTGSVLKKGFFEVADGGTLFLDEINSMSLDMQAKLLRVLQEKRYRRVGSNEYRKCDIRVIAASNQDLLNLSNQGIIRKDFYYRISTLTIEIPSLTQRKEDIPLLGQHILNQLCVEYGRSTMKIANTVMNLFLSYEWPGNVRELHHVLEYAINHSKSHALVLYDENMPDYLKKEVNITHSESKINEHDELYKLEKSTSSLEINMGNYEKKLIASALEKNNGNVTHAARMLGISRQSMQYRLKKHGL